MTDISFFERLRNLDTLTKSEAKVSDFFEANYPSTAFETIASIARNAGVGKATVDRFLKRLGYKSFQSFKQDIQAGVVQQLDSPLSRYSAKKSENGGLGNHPLEEHVQTTIRNLNLTQKLITPKLLDDASRLMAGCKGRLYIMGAATSQSLAHYFFLLSKYLRDNVVLLDASLTSIRHNLVDVNADDALFVIVHSRYASMSQKVAEWFKKNDCPVVLLSDMSVTPVSRYADIQLVTSSKGTPLFNSRVAAMVVMEALLISMTPHLEAQFIERHQLFQQLRKEFGSVVRDPS